jgi:hypothetical protein
MGTHPVPQSYYDTHTALETWSSAEWEEMRADGLLDETQRQDYN